MDHLCKDCSRHHERVEELLKAAGIPFQRDRSMVRGLDYYTRTVFEVHFPALGAQSALGGGGRYDRLVEEIGGQSVPAVGFSAGIERLLLAVEAEKTLDPAELRRRGAYIVLLTTDAEAPAMSIATGLRGLFPVEVDLTGRGMKAQLKSANARDARFALLLGEDELKAGAVAVKDLDSGEQVSLPEAELLAFMEKISSA